MNGKPAVNLSQIQFPSDSLSIGTIRRLHGDGLDRAVEPSFFSDRSRAGADDTIGLLLYTERLIASMAFNEIAGSEEAELCTQQEYSDALAEMYERYGIASGKHHAQELIRGFVSQAAGQARRVSGQNLNA